MIRVFYNAETKAIERTLDLSGIDMNTLPRYNKRGTFIDVEALPEIDPRYEYHIVENGTVQVGYLETTEETRFEYIIEDWRAELAECHQNLDSTDYKALKYIDGEIPEEEYAIIKAQRQAWRNRINELEELLTMQDN